MFGLIERLMENVELSMNIKTKKYVDKTDIKKIKSLIDK